MELQFRTNKTEIICSKKYNLIFVIFQVRTPRNLLIFNLALTDLALAATIPLSTMDALSKYWPWGNQTNWLCKISKSVPTTLVFMGSVIIVVIAVDRYRCIVMRNSRQMTQALSLFVLPISLGIASTVSFPLMIHSQVRENKIVKNVQINSHQRQASNNLMK